MARNLSACRRLGALVGLEARAKDFLIEKLIERGIAAALLSVTRNSSDFAAR